MRYGMAKPGVGVARRGARVRPFIVMDVLREAQELQAAGVDVVRMEVGQPVGPAPRKVLEAAAAAMRNDDLGYTEARGILPLRERIARYYAEQHGIDVPVERIFITTGSSAAFTLALTALFNTGDFVAVANPGYPAYLNILWALDVNTILLPAGEAEGWVPTEQGVAQALDDGARGVLLASPVNPTGAMIPAQRLEALVRLVLGRGRAFISDEIYHRLTYGEEAQTALAFSDDVVVINSFSKYYAMTGWRVGWMVVPEWLTRTVEVLAQNMFISAPAIAQHAALAAFDAEDELQERKARYAANRAFLLDALPGMGLGKVAPADGAFYLYVDVRGLSDDSVALARRLLHEAHVALTPGVDFDPLEGQGALRLSYCGSEADMERACERLARWLQAQPR